MRNSDDSRALGFLISLAALPLVACPSDDGDATASDDDDSTGADDDGTSMTDPSVTMTDPEGSGSSGPSTVADSSDGTGIDPTTSSSDDGSDSGSSGDSSGTTGEPGLCPEDAEVTQVCTDFAAHFVECYPDYAGERMSVAHECTCYLEYYAPTYGESCGTAVEDYYSCLVTADCEEITTEMACLDERMIVDTECV